MRKANAWGSELYEELRLLSLKGHLVPGLNCKLTIVFERYRWLLLLLWGKGNFGGKAICLSGAPLGD